MIERAKRESLAGGISRSPFSAKERAEKQAVLTRRFPGFVLPVGKTKGDAIEDLVQFLLNRQRGEKR